MPPTEKLTKAILHGSPWLNKSTINHLWEATIGEDVEGPAYDRIFVDAVAAIYRDVTSNNLRAVNQELAGAIMDRRESRTTSAVYIAGALTNVLSDVLRKTGPISEVFQGALSDAYAVSPIQAILSEVRETVSDTALSPMISPNNPSTR